MGTVHWFLFFLLCFHCASHFHLNWTFSSQKQRKISRPKSLTNKKPKSPEKGAPELVMVGKRHLQWKSWKILYCVLQVGFLAWAWKILKNLITLSLCLTCSGLRWLGLRNIWPFLLFLNVSQFFLFQNGWKGFCAFLTQTASIFVVCWLPIELAAKEIFMGTCPEKSRNPCRCLVTDR